MENLLATYRDEEEDDGEDEEELNNGALDQTMESPTEKPSSNHDNRTESNGITKRKKKKKNPDTITKTTWPKQDEDADKSEEAEEEELQPVEEEDDEYEELEEDDEEEENMETSPKSKYPEPSDNDNAEEDDDEEENPIRKKQKALSSFISQSPLTETDKTPPPQTETEAKNIETAEVTTTKSKKTAKSAAGKKPKKKTNTNVWTKSTSRKGKKKPKTTAPEDPVLITPVPRFPDKNDDSPDMKICLSKAYKAEKVELSDDRLSASSSKGYRMVRATRGVIEGAWYFEIKVVKLGETGHTRLGWSTDKGDLQAPVGYDANSFGYRDVDGSKVHKAVREKYAEEGYIEGDVIGFYISLPEGSLYAPKPPKLVWYKGQKYGYAPDGKEDPPKVVPGSEISFFKNGVCQGVAFTDLYGGRYYPAASMYTLPNQPNCVVKFNFGPEFEYFPPDIDGRPAPKPMIEVPYHGYYSKDDVAAQNGTSTEDKL